jgi:hypothetical protein
MGARCDVMAQFAWPALTEQRKNRHLDVAHVLAGVTDDPAVLMRLLIDRLRPEGDFALSAQETPSATIFLCAFALATDADSMIGAINAHENDLHHGWASEHHCLIDKTLIDKTTAQAGATAQSPIECHEGPGQSAS